LAEFRLGATEEIKSWVLSFGPEAEVLGPAKLREEVAAEIRAMQCAYADVREPPRESPLAPRKLRE
jgi:predicted DNA-binding transcriptional regulator YafY